MASKVPVVPIVLVLVFALALLGWGWREWQRDAAWPWNRIAGIARSLAGQCDSSQIVQVSLSRTHIAVGCAENGRIVIHAWTQGSRDESSFGMPSSWKPFALDSLNLERAAELAAQEDTRALTVSATDDAAEPTVKHELVTGDTSELTPQMLPKQ